MTAELFHNARIVTVAHTIVIALALCLPRVAGCVRPRPIVMPTELVIEIPPELIGPPEQKPAPEPPDTAAITLQEKKEPPKETMKPEVKKTEKKPDKVQPKPKQEKVGQFVSAKKPKRTLTAAEIRKLMELGARPVEDASAYVNDTMYFEIIRRTMYAAWTQPKTGAAGLTTSMLFSLNEDGTITDWNMVAGSGNADMDASVAVAAKSVSRIPGLPADFVKRNKSVTVDFKLSAQASLWGTS